MAVMAAMAAMAAIAAIAAIAVMVGTVGTVVHKAGRVGRPYMLRRRYGWRAFFSPAVSTILSNMHLLLLPVLLSVQALAVVPVAAAEGDRKEQVGEEVNEEVDDVRDSSEAAAATSTVTEHSSLGSEEPDPQRRRLV